MRLDGVRGLPFEPPRLSGAVVGAAWMVALMFCFTLLGALAKLLGDRVRTEHIVFFRCLFGAVALLPLLLRYGLPVLRPSRPWLNWWNALLRIGGIGCGFYAIRNMPVADAIAIAFTSPFFTVVFARIFLKEKLTWRGVLAVALGFVGMLLVAKPSGTGDGIAFLVALAGAVCNGATAVFMRPLVESERPATLLLYSHLVMAALVLPPVLVVPLPDFAWGTVAGLLAIGTLALLGQMAALRAYAATTPGVLAPVSNVQLPFAVLFGFLFFAEIPDALALLGMATIVAAMILPATEWRDPAQAGRAGA